MLLSQTIYHSRCRPDLDARIVLGDVLSVSHSNNPKRGLTGGLAVLDDRFLQVLEGPGDAVEAMMLRLYRDDRHLDIRIVCTRPIGDRLFTDWSMASARLSDEMTATVARVFHDPFADADVICGLLLAALPTQRRRPFQANDSGP
ncbi:MAG: BLUF domain-containing protein [Pseudomonadota bacterium]